MIVRSHILALAIIAYSCALTLSFALVVIACCYMLVLSIIIYNHTIVVAFSVCCHMITCSCGLVMIICSYVIGSDSLCSPLCDE